MKQLYCLVSLVLLGGNDSKDLVFFTGYEADEVTSGLEKDLPEAKDAISRSGTVSRGGKHSICHKIANAKEYVSYNAHRAESTTMYDKASSVQQRRSLPLPVQHVPASRLGSR